MELAKNRIDTQRAEEGVWVDMDDARLRIASWMNEGQRAYVTQRMEPYQRTRPGSRAKNIEEEIAEDILIESVARHVLLGWENLTDNGAPLVYSTNKAKELLSDKQLRWFYEFVVAQAQDLDNFIQTEVEHELEAVGKP